MGNYKMLWYLVFTPQDCVEPLAWFVNDPKSVLNFSGSLELK